MTDPTPIQPVESPVIRKPSRTPIDRLVNHVFAMPERAAYEMRFPNVEGYVYALRRPSVKADFSTLERLVIEPDYLVRLRSGTHLLLETKEEEDDQDRAKYQAARRWVAAVNNWGRLGVLDFAVCCDPQSLPRLAQLLGRSSTGI